MGILNILGKITPYIAAILGLAFSSIALGSTKANLPKFIEVTAGEKHSCALTEKGRVFCWGDNSIGQLGIGNHIAKLDIPGEILSEKSFKHLSAGNGHTCAVTTDLELMCWGAGQYGQNGSATFANLFTPTRVGNLNRPTQISAGAEHTCVVTEDLVGYCWGRGDSGQLGTGGSALKVAQPKEVLFNSRIVAVATGGAHSCFLSESYVTYCSGSNSHGQIGQKDKSMSLEPIPVEALLSKKLTALAAGGRHTCVLDENGAALCFGAGEKGQLGNGGLTSSHSPVNTSSEVAFSAINLGDSFSCGISADGIAYCWGLNASKQLGTGEENGAIAIPTSVVTDSNLVSTGLGIRHSCWIDDKNSALCNGDGAFGKLGTNSETQEPLPKRIEKVFSSTAKKVLKYCRNSRNTIIRMVMDIQKVDTCIDLALKADDIRAIDLSGKDLKWVGGIQVFGNLESLNLNNNNIQDLTPVTKLWKLKEIKLNHNKLTRKIGEVLRNATSLTRISIAHNELKDTSFIGSLPRGKLKYLDASHNQIQDMLIDSYKNLEHIDLSHNKIGSPRHLGSLKKLKFLDVSQNNELYVAHEFDTLNQIVVFRAAHTKLKELNMFKAGKAPNIEEIDISGTLVRDITMLRGHRHIKVFKADKTPISKANCPTDAASKAVWIYCSNKRVEKPAR